MESLWRIILTKGHLPETGKDIHLCYAIQFTQIIIFINNYILQLIKDN